MDIHNVTSGDAGLILAIVSILAGSVKLFVDSRAAGRKAETDRQAVKDKFDADRQAALDKMEHDFVMQDTKNKLASCETDHQTTKAGLDSVKVRLTVAETDRETLRAEVKVISAQLQESNLDRAKQQGLLEALRQSLAMLRDLPSNQPGNQGPSTTPGVQTILPGQPVVTTTVTTTTPGLGDGSK